MEANRRKEEPRFPPGSSPELLDFLMGRPLRLLTTTGTLVSTSKRADLVLNSDSEVREAGTSVLTEQGPEKSCYLERTVFSLPEGQMGFHLWLILNQVITWD